MGGLSAAIHVSLGRKLPEPEMQSRMEEHKVDQDTPAEGFSANGLLGGGPT